jgi:peptide/nickel transport system permease protein
MKYEFLTNLLKRLLSSIIVLFLIVSFVFILIRIAPGDPSQKYISPKLNPVLAEKVKQSFNLNAPVITQYFSFIKNIGSGDFGISYNYHKPVFDVVKEYLPLTLILSLVSFILQLVIGIFLAILVSKKLNGTLDRVLSKIILILYIIPVFVLGLFLIYIFSVRLNILPSNGIKSLGAEESGFLVSGLDIFKHLVLPVITLSVSGIAVFYKYLRSNIEEIYNKTFIQYLISQGLQGTEIFKKHVIPNVINPMISVAGVELGLLLGGTLITEIIFSLPGMGRLTMNAIIARDYPLVVGCTLTASVLMLISNFIADLIKALIDKRHIKGIA